MDYPSRVGILPTFGTVGLFPGSLPHAAHVYLNNLQKRDLESFCQTWLFFGLIHEILGGFCDLEQFSFTQETAEGPCKILSTSTLIENLEQWVVDNTGIRPSYEHTAECLCSAHATLMALPSDFDPEMKLSLASMGQTFTYAADKAFNTMPPYRRCPSTWSKLIDDGYWETRLIGQGWCRSQIKLISETAISLQTLHFLSCMGHIDSQERHRLCDTQQCKAYQNDLESYQTRHLDQFCHCEELAIDPGVLFQILKQGALPLLRVNNHQSVSGLSVDVVPSGGTARYVALSHLWANGLGNPHANALPRCQLSYLSKAIRRLNGEVNFQHPHELLLWCDTLCCPIGPKEAKSMALREMYRTYQDATCVLVLESSLLPYDLDTLQTDEVWVRILTSSWMRRLWTLQEGALPAKTQRLWFQFRNNAINIRDLRVSLKDAYLQDIGRTGLAGDMFMRLGSFANFFLKDVENPGADLRAVIDALQHRSVSVPSDEPLLIATLLGLDIGHVLRGPESERYSRLWRLMPSALRGIPKGVLFRIGPRLTQKGLKWAPATLLLNEDSDWMMETTGENFEQGFLTASDGLLVHLAGFRITLPQRPKRLLSYMGTVTQRRDKNRLWMRNEDGSWYMVYRSLPVEQDNFLTNETLVAVLGADAELWITHINPDFPPHPNSTKGSFIGLVVQVTSETEMVKKAQSKLRVTFGLIEKSIEDRLKESYELAQKLKTSSAAHQVAHFDESEVDINFPAYKSALDALRSELHQLVLSDKAKVATAVAGQNTEHVAAALIEDLTWMIFMGQYVSLGERVPRTRQWCVD